MTEPTVAPAWLPRVMALLSGYAYLGVAALLTLLLTPVYVRLLGPTAWGEVAFCLGIQGVLFGLDAAFGPMLLREVARAARAGHVALVHRRFLRLYGGVALAVFVVGQAALLLADPSLLAEPPWPLRAELVWALRLALVQFLFQFANLATIGTWHGEQRQVFANARMIAFVLAKHATALLLVAQWNAIAIAYFLPFAVLGALECAVNLRRFRRERRSAAAAVGVAAESAARTAAAAARGVQQREREVAVSPALPSPLRMYLLGALLGMLSVHLDRMVLAFALPRAEFGGYFLLGIVVLSLLHLQLPVQRVFVPRVVAGHRPGAALAAMRWWMGGLLAIPTLVLAVFADTLLRLWIGDAAFAEAAAPALRLMLVAAACLAIAAPSQAWLLREARFRAVATLNLLVLLAQAGVLLLMVPRHGMAAGAWAWLTAGMLQLGGCLWLARAAKRTPDHGERQAAAEPGETRGEEGATSGTSPIP